MSSVEDLVSGLNAVVELTQSMKGHILVATFELERAQTLLGQVTFGSNNPYPREAIGALEQSREASGEAHGMLAGVERYISVYVGQISSPSGGDGSASPMPTRGPSSDGLSDREWRLGVDPATRQFRRGETYTARRIEDQRGVVLVRSPDEKGPDWVGPDGKTYDAVGPFAAKYFDRQWKVFKGRIVDHLDKAYWVPVDVSLFTPEQIAQVREFIGPLGPRVFILGE